MCSSFYFPLSFSCCKELSCEPEILRPQPRISRWEVIGIEWLDIRHLPIDVWQQFSNLIEFWSCTTASPPSPTIFFFSFFFYTKIHESLASGVTEGWIKVLWLPLQRLKSPQFKLNIFEWRDHSPKVIYNGATQSEIDGWDFQLCAREMFPAICSNVFYFSSLPLATYVSQRGRGKWRNVSSVYPPVLCAAPGFIDTI